ncbi:MAG: HAMP domain-containing protein [Magnetospirillum sp.]|nr:HAMP domain-containing protein [Magnetospirillum sp.]
MRIGVRLLAGFGALCALLAVISGLAVIEASRVDGAVTRITGFRIPVAETSGAIGRNVYMSLAALRGYLLTGNEGFKRERELAWTDIAALSLRMDALAPRFTDPRNGQMWTEAKQLLGELHTAQGRAEQAGPGEEAVKILAGEAIPRVRRLVVLFEGEQAPDGKRTGGLIDNQRALLDRDAAQAANDTNSLQWGSLLGLILGLLVAAVVVAVTRAKIVPPIVSITTVMSQLADGNLTVSVPGRERRDEIGEMAAALEIFRTNLVRQRELEARQRAEDEARKRRATRIEELTAGFDRSAETAVQTVASAAQQLQGTAEGLSATAEQTSAQATAVAAASEEASVNVQTVASAAEELSGSINEISRQVTHASEISASAVTEAGRAETAVAELARTVQKIGDVVKLIDDIASQTNLLALNATIEAARAGEAGKGFAVVANEVKGLANQTGRATGEIGQQITEVQEQTTRVVATIQGIVHVIEEVGQISASIAIAVEEQSAATKEIARNVEQAAAGTAEVSSNVVGVQAAADQTGLASREVLVASRGLNAEAEGLKRLIGSFLADVRAV